jgi:osmotically-inducible protein OsmY
MSSDHTIRRNVEEELRDSLAHLKTNITVRAHDGIITLTGTVATQAAKLEAEDAALRVGGVHAVANELRVIGATDRRPDVDIAREAVAAIAADLPTSSEQVQVVVREGEVTLEGQVDWLWQRQRIESVVRDIAGVLVVSNLITLRSHADAVKSAATLPNSFVDAGISKSVARIAADLQE